MDEDRYGKRRCFRGLNRLNILLADIPLNRPNIGSTAGVTYLTTMTT